MEYYDSVCFLSVVFTSRCVGKFCNLARPSVSRDIKFSNPSRSKYNRQKTHTVIIFYIYPIGWLVVLGFNATLTAKFISWRSVTYMYMFRGTLSDFRNQYNSLPHNLDF